MTKMKMILTGVACAFAMIALASDAQAGLHRVACPPHAGAACFVPDCCPAPCPPTKTLVLNVTNPACCHDHACVKVCVPACCDGPPKVCARCGILGRGIVTYEWCCGHRVTVVFTARGTVRVR